MRIDWPWRKVERGVHSRQSDVEEKIKEILKDLSAKVETLDQRLDFLEDHVGDVSQDDLVFIRHRIDCLEQHTVRASHEDDKILKVFPKSAVLLVVSLSLAAISAGGLFWLFAYMR